MERDIGGVLPGSSDFIEQHGSDLFLANQKSVKIDNFSVLPGKYAESSVPETVK